MLQITSSTEYKIKVVHESLHEMCTKLRTNGCRFKSIFQTKSISKKIIIELHGKIFYYWFASDGSLDCKTN